MGRMEFVIRYLHMWVSELGKWVWRHSNGKIKNVPCTKCELMCSSAIHCFNISDSHCATFSGFCFFPPSLSLSALLCGVQKHLLMGKYAKVVHFSRALTCLITALFRSPTLRLPFMCLCNIMNGCTSTPRVPAATVAATAELWINLLPRERERERGAGEQTQEEKNERPTLANGKNVNVALKRTNNGFGNTMVLRCYAFMTMDKNQRKKLLQQIGLRSAK